ncbi:golgin subfamily A member 6-like protein 25 isoform X2 [Corythoichthys intestinalis]|uniref:golgin subfamily A member 6-like protein 25 isoform X2 n=1 Tax=Corythoichthys intestinalis TaxID=161448 RepID=UPI0025A5FC18|nr:golgin subfamily A member 6-like protein 25 isoform X2 [Corythoichthys intestinalis]
MDLRRGLQASPVRDFDRISELRAEKHEQLRRRTNVTSCRSPAKDYDTALLKHTLSNKRQEEFRKRRSLPRTPEEDRGSSRFSTCDSASFFSLHGGFGDVGGRENVMMKMMAKEDTWMEEMKIENSTHQMDSVDHDAHAPQQKMREVSVQTESGLLTVEESDILQLQDYMQESLWREEAITKKVAALQECFLQLQKALSSLWKTRCSEDALRNKIKVLETQLQACLQVDKSSVSSQRLPKDVSRKQTKKQKMTFEEKSQMITQEKNEELNKTVALKEALISAKTDVLRMQSLYEELKLTSRKLRQELDVSYRRAREHEVQIEFSRTREATLTEELVSLRREKNELRLKMSLLEEYQQRERDQMQNCSDGDIVRRDVSVQSTPEEENAFAKGDCIVGEKFLHVRDQLRFKEIECESLKTALHTMEETLQSSQTRLSQCREELLHSKPTRNVTRRSLRVFLVLLFLTLLAVAAIAALRPWLPLFGEKVEDFYLDMERRMENYFMQMQNSGCFRPI